MHGIHGIRRDDDEVEAYQSDVLSHLTATDLVIFFGQREQQDIDAADFCMSFTSRDIAQDELLGPRH